MKYKIYAQDMYGNQISRDYIVKNPYGLIGKIIVLWVQLLHFNDSGEVFCEGIK